jgi:hypothetical protein
MEEGMKLFSSQKHSDKDNQAGMTDKQKRQSNSSRRTRSSVFKAVEQHTEKAQKKGLRLW